MLLYLFSHLMHLSSSFPYQEYDQMHIGHDVLVCMAGNAAAENSSCLQKVPLSEPGLQLNIIFIINSSFEFWLIW